jgi:hypothetical protein
VGQAVPVALAVEQPRLAVKLAERGARSSAAERLETAGLVAPVVAVPSGPGAVEQ